MIRRKKFRKELQEKAGYSGNLFAVLLLLHLFLVFPSLAQKARFEFFTPAEGLAGNNTSTVTQDDQGFLWFVNDGKIHRFDGRNFIVYAPPEQAPDNMGPFVGLASFEDSLLFTWSEHYTYMFNPRTGDWKKNDIISGSDTTYNAHFNQRLGMDQILLTRIEPGLNEESIWRFHNNRMEPLPIKAFTRSSDNFYYWCDFNSSGQMFLANKDTLFQMDPMGKVIDFAPFNSICADCYNVCFQFEPDDDLIMLVNWKFYILEKGYKRMVPHPVNRFLTTGKIHLHRFIMEDNGSIWACGADRNLVYYDAAVDTLYDFSGELKILLPNQNDFKGLYEDNTGLIWIDTRLGLLKVKPQRYPFENYFENLNNSNAYYSFRGITEDVRGFVYAVFYDGIAMFDPSRKRPEKVLTFDSDPYLFDLFEDKGVIWANGGQYLDPSSGRLVEVASPFLENPTGDNGFFSRDINGTLWWAAHYSLYYLDWSGARPKWEKEIDLPEKVYNKTGALHAGLQSGLLWIGFRGMLYHYDPERKTLQSYNLSEQGLNISRIMAIEEDSAAKLWLGTDAGLVHFDPELKTVDIYTVQNGLPDNFICGLLPDGDTCLWLSTNHGLSRFHLPSGSFANFFEDDGLTNAEFNRKSYFKAKDGRMYFGGIQGINAFYPKEIQQIYKRRNLAARMALSAFECTDERRDTIVRRTHFGDRPEIHLHHWEWSYNFEYALTDYDSPEEIFYSYQMEGYKDSWSTPSRFNFTRFNSLPAGEYIFRVKGRDSRGSWHPNELAVKVIVHSPWWSTWLAYTIYGIVLVMLFLLLRRYEMNRQRLKYNFEIEKLEAGRLKELNQFKTRLYTNLTHEFRTPLTVILGMIDQIKANPQKHLEQGVNLIKTNGHNLLQLINQLLDLSKMENQSFQLNMQQGDIVSFLRYTTELFEPYADGKDLSIRFVTSLDTLRMDFDPVQISQVLSNLISNAVKFTPSGGEITVRLNQSGKMIHLEVEDDGIGISPKDLPRIFDRFYQVDSSATRKGEGTGIGLAYAQELVKLMGGDITVTSIEGKGSVFQVQLPVKLETAEGEASPEKTSAKEWKHIDKQEFVADLKGQASLPRLLLIEDNHDLVVYLRSCLEDLYQVDVAYDGQQGIDKAIERIPEIIISDVMMPYKDGFEVCDTLKHDERSSHIPIILLTAKADARSKIDGLRRGADAYISKPFDKEELLVTLQMLLERQKRMAGYFSSTILEGTPPVTEDKEIRESVQVEDHFIQKIKQVIESHYTDENFALPQLCDIIGMSRSQLFRKVKALVNDSPSGLIRTYRLNKAKDLLETTDLTVSEVAWQVGYKDPAHFSRSFQEDFGRPPSSIRNN